VAIRWRRPVKDQAWQKAMHGPQALPVSPPDRWRTGPTGGEPRAPFAAAGGLAPAFPASGHGSETAPAVAALHPPPRRAAESGWQWIPEMQRGTWYSYASDFDSNMSPHAPPLRVGRCPRGGRPPVARQSRFHGSCWLEELFGRCQRGYSSGGAAEPALPGRKARSLLMLGRGLHKVRPSSPGVPIFRLRRPQAPPPEGGTGYTK
jgi:hypothetical protein